MKIKYLDNQKSIVRGQDSESKLIPLQQTKPVANSFIKIGRVPPLPNTFGHRSSFFSPYPFRLKDNRLSRPSFSTELVNGGHHVVYRVGWCAIISNCNSETLLLHQGFTFVAIIERLEFIKHKLRSWHMQFSKAELNKKDLLLRIVFGLSGI